MFPAYYVGNVHGVNIVVSLCEDVTVPGLKGGSALSDNVVTKNCIEYIILASSAAGAITYDTHAVTLILEGDF
jgi:hypothetical protein